MTSNSVAVIRYQYDNHLGSASLELDENADIISYEEYHPFGTTSYRSGRTETETSQKRYKYVGKERDEETGLYYYGFRYYAAWLCRFVSVDPLQFDYPHYTPFQYAGNKPISYIDLDGLEPALPDHIKPTDRIKGPGKLSGMTYQFLLDVLTASYQKVMEDKYIVKDGKGGHQFDEKRWKKENVSHLTRKDSGTEKAEKALSAFKNARTNANTIINSKEYNVFFHNAPIEHTKNNYGFSNDLDSFIIDGGSWFNDLYNSAIGRKIVPDFIAIGFGFNGIVGAGGATSIEARWVTHGPEASWLPMITVTQAIGGGYSLDATFNVETANYIGDVNLIKRRMMKTSTPDGNVPTAWGSGGIALGGKIGITGYVTPNVAGSFIIGSELNIGAGLPLGPLPGNGAGGVSNTWILYDFNN